MSFGTGFNRVTAALFLLFAVGTGCGSSSTSTTASSFVGGPNVLEITVDGSQCDPSDYYVNEPCTSVTICSPSTGTCQTISNILVDTGSFGLRIFSSAIHVSLDQVNDGSSNPVAECATFGSATTWGPVEKANVELAGEGAVEVPIQVIDSTFGTPVNCGTPETSPSEAGFNGILGVGLLQYDCGTYCAGNASNSTYYSCVGTTCTGTELALVDQVQNPVSLLPVDNNGVILALPGISSGGAGSVTGSLILGIGTQSNNTPSGQSVFQASGSLDFDTTFNGTDYTTSFIDSGSNGLFFPSPSASTLPDCSSSRWFCPTSLQSFTAVQSSGGTSQTVSFSIGNFTTLTSSDSAVFSDIGAAPLGGEFVWGLPFFFGRNVFVGIDGTSSTLGTGPYWAY